MTNAVVAVVDCERQPARERVRRVHFQPETRSYPSSSFASSCGISAGSSWRSASIVTIDVALRRRRSRRSARPPCRSSGAGERRGRSSALRGADELGVRAVRRAVVDVDDLPAGALERVASAGRRARRRSRPRCRAARRSRRADSSGSPETRSEELEGSASEALRALRRPGHVPSIRQAPEAPSSGRSPNLAHPFGQHSKEGVCR